MQRYISHLLIALIVGFALTSYGNVTEYIKNYHDAWTGNTLGACFGLAVVACAYIVAKRRDPAARWSALAVGMVFGLASAWFQTKIYQAGGAPFGEALAMSFIPIVFGEVGLAVVEFYYSRETEAQELNPLQSQLDELQSLLADVQQRLTNSEQQSDERQKLADQRKAQTDKLQKELEEVKSQLDKAHALLDDFSPASVLRRLNDTQRQKLSELTALVDGQRIESPGDLIRHGMSKSDVYALWPVAVASQLIYPNGDDAYHVRQGA